MDSSLLFPWKRIILCIVCLHSMFVFAVNIHGAGSSIASPVYQLVMFCHQVLNATSEFSYQGIGSGAGIRQLEARSADFAGSEIILSSSAYESNKDIQMYPTMAVGVALYHNLDLFAEKTRNLVLTRAAAAKIFLGHAYFWDDVEITSTNNNISLPHSPINLYVRSSSSGTTEILTRGLSAFSDEFSRQIGISSFPNWCKGSNSSQTTSHIHKRIQYSCTICFPKNNSHPTRICFVENSQLLLELVATDTFSIGYAVYQPETQVKAIFMVNKAGVVVSPSTNSISYSTMELGANLGEQLTANLIDASSSNGWPLTSYTYIVLLKKDRHTSCIVREILVQFWVWFYQTQAVQNIILQKGLAPLPAFIAEIVTNRLIHDVQCVHSDGTFQLALSYGSDKETALFSITDTLLSTMIDVNTAFNDFVSIKNVWKFTNGSSSAVFASLAALNFSFALYIPDLVDVKVQQDFFTGAAFTAPYILQAIVPVYFLPDLNSSLNLTSALLADIFLCKIVRWNDPFLVELNPELENSFFSNQNITLLTFSEKGDSAHILMKFLSETSSVFRSKYGTSDELKPSCGLRLEFEAQVLSEIQQIAGSFSFTSLYVAETLSIQMVNLLPSVPQFQQTISPNLQNVQNCLTSPSVLASQLSSTALILDLSTAQYWQTSCWPITAVVNILAQTTYSAAIPAGVQSCKGGIQTSEYIKWLLTQQTVLDKWLSNFSPPLPQAILTESWHVLENNMNCDGTLLLLKPSLCTPKDYHFTMQPCQGWLQSQLVKFSWNSGVLCQNGTFLPENFYVECDHIIWSSAYSFVIIFFCMSGILVWVFMLVLKCKTRNFFRELKIPHRFFNEISLLISLLTSIVAPFLCIGPASDSRCSAQLWLLNILPDFIFSIFYSKMHTGRKIFQSKRCAKIKISFKMLCISIVQIIGPEIIIILLWAAASKPQMTSTFRYSSPISPALKLPSSICSSKYEQIFQLTLSTYRGFWIVKGFIVTMETMIGTNVAFQIWNIKANQGEIRSVALAMFTCIVCSAIGIIFRNMCTDLLTSAFVTALTSCCTAHTTICLVSLFQYKLIKHQKQQIIPIIDLGPGVASLDVGPFVDASWQDDKPDFQTRRRSVQEVKYLNTELKTPS